MRLQIASPVNPEVPAIHSTNKERDFEKKIKGLDKLATSIGDNNVKGAVCKENRSSERFFFIRLHPGC